MQFGHAGRFGTLETDNRDHVGIEFARAESDLHFLLSVKNPRSCAYLAMLRRDRAHLYHRTPQISVENLEAAIRAEGVCRAAQDCLVAALGRCRPEREAAAVKIGLLGVEFERMTCDGSYVLVQEVRANQRFDQESGPARGRKMIYIRGAIGVDPREQWYGFG